MLVDKNIHAYWVFKYGKMNQIQRFGIEDENGETIVEIYLKRFNLYPFPNKTLFKFPVNKDYLAELDQNRKFCAFTQPIYISKCSTIDDLKSKITRLLSYYIYNTLKNKHVMVTKVRLWKSNYEEGEALKSLQELESK